LAGIGFAQSLILDLPPLPEAAAGAMFGSGLFFLMGKAFRRWRGYAGLGLGDIKFAGAAGLWIGLQGVPIMILAASLSALVFVALQALVRRSFDRRAPLPFGPFLCTGTLLTWLFNSVMPV
jgi:leader peptidase (prepilin peptidase) / N-methyltransferase